MQLTTLEFKEGVSPSARYFTSSPAIGADGIVYIGSHQGYLYALGGQKSTKLDEESKLPAQIKLHQNYPNPFNPLTNIDFTLPDASHVKLIIYNTVGQKVSTLVNRKMPAGTHSVRWDASRFTSGIYFYRLKANGIQKSRKMLLVK